MGYFTRSIEQLNAEYTNRTSITVFGRQATLLRLLADSYEVRLRFERLLEQMKEGPTLTEDNDLKYGEWADESRWVKPDNPSVENTQRTAVTFGFSEDSPFAQTYANRMKDAFGERLNNIDLKRFNLIVSSVVTTSDVISDFEFDLAIDENIRQLRKALQEIDTVKSTKRWKKNDYARTYQNLKGEYDKNEWLAVKVRSDHNKWLKENVADPDLADYEQRRRELLLQLFQTGFLDCMKANIHVLAEDDVKFAVIKDEELMPNLDDTLKWYAAFKKLCPIEKDYFRFNEYGTLGRYIYDNCISQEVCFHFFHLVALIEIVQQEMEWLKHPDLKPQGEDETVANFVERVVQIMLKAEDRNGEVITYKDKRGNDCTYKFNVDGKMFTKVMKQVQDKYPELILGYLDGKTGDNALGVTKVCPFIGRVLSLSIFNKADVRNMDFEQAFQFVYGETNEKGKKRSFIQKMSETRDIKDKPVFNTIKTLYEEQNKAQLLGQ